MAGTEYYDSTGAPAQGSSGSSSVMRSEFDAVQAGFDKLPDLAGNGSKIVAVNSGATELEAVTTTGTGSAVRATSPTLVTPILGTPTSGTLTNCTGLMITSGLAGLTALTVPVINTTAAITLLSATALKSLRVNSGGTAWESFTPLESGGALGTPTSGTLTNCTGLPQAGTVGLTTSDSPQFAGINLGHASDTTLTRTGAGAIAVEGTAVLLSGGALGTPSSGNLSNCTVDGTNAGLGQGKHTVWIPAGAMTARTTNGAASGTAETTTNKVMLSTLDFDQSTVEYAQFNIRMPKSWNESTVTAYFLWSSAVSGTNAVVWALQAVALSDDDALDTAFGTAQSVTDAQTAQGDLMQTAETSAITVAGTPADADWVVFQVYRNASDGADTLAGDARLHGVVLIYSINAATDA